MKDKKYLLIGVNLLAAFSITFAAGYFMARDDGLTLTPSAEAQRSRVNLPDFSPLVEELRPSVVYVVVSGAVPENDERIPENHPDIPPDQEKGVGSGFIIDRSGNILTNDHVVADSKKVEVVLPSGNKYTANVVGRDPQLDVALIKIKPREALKPIVLGDSGKTKVGQWVLAMGNPFGLENNVTVGVISGKGRELAEAPFVDFLQTDAAIYPGNSGGPLIDLDGKAIGINTAVVPGTQLGFSVPIDKVKEVLQELKTEGRVTRGYIGVEMAPVSPQVPNEAASEKGALIVKVRSGPAKTAGIRANDIIIEYNGKKIDSPNDLAKAVDKSEPGQRVNVTVKRDKTEKKFTFTVIKAPTPGETSPENNGG